MRRLFAVVLLLTMATGVLALLAPTPAMADPGGGRCRHVCDPPFDPSWPGCGPCMAWDSCGGNCGCRPIPGCKI